MIITDGRHKVQEKRHRCVCEPVALYFKTVHYIIFPGKHVVQREIDTALLALVLEYGLIDRQLQSDIRPHPVGIVLPVFRDKEP